jgi:hypothetical protein
MVSHCPFRFKKTFIPNGRWCLFTGQVLRERAGLAGGTPVSAVTQGLQGCPVICPQAMRAAM